MNQMLNSLNPTYKQPYGCGTIAIANALFWKKAQVDLKKIQTLLQEKNFISFSNQVSKTLEKLKHEISFFHQEEVNIQECLKALDNKCGVILLTWPDGKNEIGHYSFFYRNNQKQMLENDKLSAPVLFKELASKKNPKNGKKPMAWIVK